MTFLDIFNRNIATKIFHMNQHYEKDTLAGVAGEKVKNNLKGVSVNNVYETGSVCVMFVSLRT